MTARVHAQRDLKDIPDSDPEIERSSFIVADGFEVNLYASDPLIAKPIQMNFDADGRLWVASSTVYPHIMPGQKADDKVLIIEDKDQDGTADTTSVFAGGLLIPTGVIPGDGGAYVVNSTEVLHLSDTDNDGKADRRRIVLSGFGTEDTHHLLHTLRWGHDGCLYMNQSIYIHSHVETPYGVKRLNGGGIWRFRPETLELDVLSYGLVNPWGHHFDAWGQSFATDGAGREGINYVFPGSVFVTSPGAKRFVSGLNPGSPKHCGLEVVSGRHLPDDWQGSLVANDFRAHRVCRFVLSEDGAGYASRQEVEVIKSTHVAFRPIDVKMGPDGAIYIADWYNPIIQHGEVDFRDPRRDHVHGRIWRVSAKGRPAVKRPKLTDASIAQLLDVLKQPEEWNRQHAKLILKTRDKGKVVAALDQWLTKLDKSESQYEHHRLEALWSYQTIGGINRSLLQELAGSTDHRVRAAAVRVASDWQEQLGREALQYYMRAVRDEHPRVRLEGVCALEKIPSREAAKAAIQALDRPMDRFLDFALWRTMRELESHWLPAVMDGERVFDGDITRLTFALKAVDSPTVVAPLLQLVAQGKVADDRATNVLTLIATLGGADELGKVFAMASSAESKLSTETKATLLEALVATTIQRKVIPAGNLGALKELIATQHLRLRAAGLRAAGVWKQESLRDAVSNLALDTTANRNERDAAIDAVTSLGGSEGVKTLNQLAMLDNFDDQLRAVRSLSVIAPRNAAKRAVELLGRLPEGIDPSLVLTVLLGRKNGPAELTTALADGKLSVDAAKRTLRAVRSGSQQSPELIAAIQKAGGLSEAGWKLTPKLLEELVAEVASNGNAHRGEAIYRRKELQCAKCHAIAGAGGRVGPDLISVGASAQVDYLVQSLITPNSKLKENFHSLVIATDDGRVVSGIPIRQNDTEVVLRDAEDRELTIPTSSIEEKKDGRSLMPDGSVDQLTRDELVDLVRFLSEVGKVGDFAVGSAQVVRRWRALTWTQEGHHRLNRTSYDIAATEDPALTWESAYSRVGGDLPLDGLPQLKPHRETPQTTFVDFDLEVSTSGAIGFRFNSIDALSLWVDSKPTPLTGDVTLELNRGRHRLTLSVDRESRKTPLRVELIPAPGSKAQAQLVAGK
ncbi:MAG: HEAT repeat domain-containing protein [Planctomycetes bacterium]|nr:HEAT repeat domain-containing protein [Planctomycetota bacterium]